MAYLGTLSPSTRSYQPAGTGWAGSGSGVSGAGPSGAQGSGQRWGPHLAGLGTAVYDVITRQYVDPSTGRPANGPIPGTTGFAVNGQFSSTPPASVATDPNLPPPLAVSRTNLTPEITAPALARIGQVNQQNDQTTRDLTSFTQTATDILNRNYERAQAATDTTGTANALNESLRRQEDAQRKLTTEAETQNRSYAADTADRIKRLTQTTNDWEAKVNALGERANAIGQTSVAAGRIGQDNVSAAEGATTSRRLGAFYSAMLQPAERIAQQRMVNLTNVEAPWMQNLYQNDVRLLDAKNALERQFGGDKRATVQYLQGLATQASQMDQQSAEFYLSQKLRLLGLPEQFLANNVSNLTALQRLLGVARVDTAAQPFDPSLIPATPSFPIVTPGRSYAPQGNAQDGTGPNARGWRDWNQSGEVGAPAQPATMPPAGTLDGDIARGLPAWALTQRYGRGPAAVPNAYNGDGGYGIVNGRYIGNDTWRDWEQYPDYPMSIPPSVSNGDYLGET